MQERSWSEELVVACRSAHPQAGVRRVSDELRRCEEIQVSKEKVLTLGNPLVLKHDGGMFFQSERVQGLLSRYQVESLTGPRHYPQYNGRRERAFRDLRSFEQVVHRHDPLLPLAVRLGTTIQELNDERPRPVLRGRTAAEVFHDRRPLIDRTFFRPEVESTHKRLLETARSRYEQESARRRAIEAVLLRTGYLEIRNRGLNALSTTHTSQNKRFWHYCAVLR